MTAEDVLRQMESFSRALQQHDFTALKAIYSDCYMLVRPDGTVLNKELVLKDLIEHKMAFHSIELQGAVVRILGSAAILTAETAMLSSRDGMENTHIGTFDLSLYTLRKSRQSGWFIFRAPRFLMGRLLLSRSNYETCGQLFIPGWRWRKCQSAESRQSSPIREKLATRHNM